MNLAPVYRFLVGARILALFDWVVTKAERVITDYRYDMYQSRYDIHETFLKRRNKGITLYGEGEIRSGPGSYIGRYSRIKAGEGTCVSIGSGCALSHGVAIYTESWVPNQDFSNRDPRDFTDLVTHSGDVVIGDDVWIGYSVFVTPGTRIGDNSVVGANAVVTRDIPPDSIAVGSPARVVGFKSYVTEERKQELVGQYASVIQEDLKNVAG